MRWRIVGIALLLVSALLIILVSYEIVVKEEQHTLLDEEGIPLIYIWEAGEYAPIWAERNSTLTPLNTTLTPPDRPSNLKYTVSVLAKSTVWNSSATKEAPIDFWVVNQTGRKRLIGYLENGTYPTTGWENRTQELPGVKAYAKGLDKALIVKFLQDMDYNGNYTIVLINPYKETSNVTVVVDETLTTKGHILELSPVVAAPMFVLMLVPGVYLTAKNPKWLGKRPRRRKRQD
jgi:hypothetical protein